MRPSSDKDDGHGSVDNNEANKGKTTIGYESST